MLTTTLTPPTTPIESPASDAFDPGAFATIPLSALSRDTHIQLSKLLNMKKILRSEDGYERDYRGIGMLAELRGLYDENSGNMDKVLQLWCNIQPKTATFGKLEEFLGKIDRWDVSDDIHENLVKDANSFNAKQIQKVNGSALTTISNSYHCNGFGDLDMPDSSADFYDWSSNPNILTRDDVQRAQENLPPQQYDAFVLFANEDVEYASEMLVLENVYNFKLCLKDRDLLAGVEFMNVPQLIEGRCKYLIAILTEQFFKSPENKFLVNFTQSHQIEENRRKIIPVRFGDVKIPRQLSIFTYLTYQQPSRFYNFWDRLADSIRHGKSTSQPINGKCLPAIAAAPVRTALANSQSAILNTQATNNTSKKSRLMNQCTTQLNLSSLQSQSPPQTPSSTLTQTPSPAISEIPSISLNGEVFDPEDIAEKPVNNINYRGLRRSVTIGGGMSSAAEDVMKSQQKLPLKAGTLNERPKSERGFIGNGTKYKKRLPLLGKFLPKLRNAHSTSQLNTEVSMCERTTSFSDLSTTSGQSEPKKKRKWSTKLKKIFSRSTTKLQETS